MSKENPRIVARKVSAKMRAGKKINMKEILLETGYSAVTAKSPSIVTNTVAYKEEMALLQRPIVDGMQEEINRIKLAMTKRNLNLEEYRTLAGSLDIMIRNYQLLTGGATQRNILVLPSEVIQKNDIEVKDDKANLLDSKSS
jgi:hypothetical protein